MDAPTHRSAVLPGEHSRNLSCLAAVMGGGCAAARELYRATSFMAWA